MSDHIKRLAAPKSWPISRKSSVFVTKPYPSGHSQRRCIAVNVLIKEMLALANNTREVKKILSMNNVLVDGVRRKDIKFPVGVMDTLQIKETGKCYRISFNKKGRLVAVEIEKSEVDLKPCKINNKSIYKGKTQLNLSDGRNILVEKDGYKTGDTVILKLPSQEIKEHLKLAKDACVFLMDGKHIGETGLITDIIGSKAKYKLPDGDVVETLSRYVLVIGKEKPSVKV